MQKSRKNPLLSVLIIGAMVALAFGGGVQYNRYRQSRDAVAADLLTLMDAGDVLVPWGEEPMEVVINPGVAEAEPEAEPEPSLAVHVKGAVEKPGLYELPQGSRVADALDMAVLLEEANTDIINLAATLSDSAEVVVPFRAEGGKTDWDALAVSAAAAVSSASAASPSSGESPAANTSSATSVININTANLTALQTLSGIGPVKAQAIIDYRTQHGPFTKIDDIKKVSGIGQATFDKIKDRLTVD